MTQPTLFDQLAEIVRPFDRSMIERFHNTTNLSGEDLKGCKFRAGKLNDKIFKYFQAHRFDNHTRFELWKVLGIRNNPETSIGRSLSDLTSLGKLEKCDGLSGRPKVQRKGKYGALCYAWRLK